MSRAEGGGEAADIGNRSGRAESSADVEDGEASGDMVNRPADD